MSHTALRREFSDLIDLDAPVDRLAGDLPSQRVRSGIRAISIYCSPTCRLMCAAVTTSAAASAR